MSEFLDLHGRTNKAVRALVDTALQAHGLRLGQDHLLAQLWARDGQTPTEIAEAVAVATPTVVKMANRLEESGLVARHRDAKDNRLVRLWLTDAGRALQAPVEETRRAVETRITAELTTAERAELLRLLGAVDQAARLAQAGPRRGDRGVKRQARTAAVVGS